MNILENAEKYAEGKANQAITKAIADAYIEGYKAGYKDREEEIPMDLRHNKTEYVDLGLPSGTLLASDYEKSDGEYIYLPYDKAKCMNLPTEEQWQELNDYCEFVYDEYYDDDENKIFKVTIIGANGNSIEFLGIGYFKTQKEDKDHALCWLHNEGDDSEKQAIYMFIWYNHGYRNKCSGTNNYFSGYKLPVRLVR